MSTRRFVALGTASQVPTRTRNHNGYFLRWDEEGLLFDPGEGTQRQMIHAGISASEITRILITHFHGDHCLGLPGILQRLSLDRVPHPVALHYPASGAGYLHNLRNASIYQATATIELHPIEAPGAIYESARLTISTERLDHTVESWGYRIEEADDVSFVPERLGALGLVGPMVGQLRREGRVEIGGRSIALDEVTVPRRGQSLAFVMDTRVCDGAAALARDVDVLVAESTFLSEHAAEAAAYGHLTAAQAATLARDAGAGRLVLTHFSQRYGETAGFVAEAAPIFPPVVAVSDGDEIDLRRARPGG